MDDEERKRREQQKREREQVGPRGFSKMNRSRLFSVCKIFLFILTSGVIFCLCPTRLHPQQEELNDAVGFSRVIHAISKSVRPTENQRPVSNIEFQLNFKRIDGI